MDDEFQELIVMFLDDLREQVAGIRAAQQQGDSEQVQKLCHQIKGSAGGYGFPAITELAMAAEHACKEQAAQATIDQKVTALLEACDAITA